MIPYQSMEIALARFFGSYNTNTVVPNVSWGLGLHECDLLCVTNSGYATEIEIKMSKADMKADLEKRHKHESHKIKYLFFAIPEQLYVYQSLVPEKAGIITVSDKEKCTMRRMAIKNGARKLSDKELIHLGYLASKRVWKLKERINNGR